MENAYQLTTQPISRLIRQIALPASVGFFFYTMFNVVDTYFGGLISTQALAALSLSFPLFFIIIAMGSGLSTGTTALIGNALGAGDRQEARLLGIQGISFALLVSPLITLIGLWASPYLFSLLGAADGYLATCLLYMNPIFAGATLFMLVHMFNAILVALGDTRSFRNFLMGGCLLNLALDPWFIYGGLGIPPLQITGIALATVFIQFIGVLYLGSKVYHTGLLREDALKDILPRPCYFREIARQGFPATLNMMTVGMGIFVITYFISRFGKEAVAAYGIATRVEQIALLPTLGLNTATLTIVAQNNGAKRFDRIKETLHLALRYGGLLMGLGTIGVFLLAEPLMGLFTSEQSVVDTGATYLRIAAFIFYAYVVLYVNVAALQGVKRPLFAIWIGIYRQILAPLLIFYLLTQIFHIGLMGIWWGIFGVTWSGALIAFLYARRLLNHIMETSISRT